MEFIQKLKQAEILEISKLLIPSPGQIFSTKLAENRLLRLELYALAKEESISGHNLLETTLYLVTDGILSINGREVKDGDFCIVEKSVCSELKAIKIARFLSIHFLMRLNLRFPLSICR